MISDTLRKQISRTGKLADLIDGKLADEQPVGAGVICTMSIPIITICALMVLWIFLALLNIIFWWLPFVRICFPCELKGKSQ
jgi:hypothetical protein